MPESQPTCRPSGLSLQISKALGNLFEYTNTKITKECPLLVMSDNIFPASRRNEKSLPPRRLLGSQVTSLQEAFSWLLRPPVSRPKWLSSDLQPKRRKGDLSHVVHERGLVLKKALKLSSESPRNNRGPRQETERKRGSDFGECQQLKLLPKLV